MSDTMFEALEKVTLQRRRCWECGRFWAYETFREGDPQCPVCAGRAIKRLQATVDKLQRGVNALRGALARMRKGRRR